MNLESQSELYETSSYLEKGRLVNSYKQVSKDGLEKFKASKTWQKRVYRKKEHLLDEQTDLIAYHILAKAIFTRDKNICQACFKTRRKLVIEGKFLTAHHIIPREDNGQNEATNLVTLCNQCHDSIEELKLRSKEEIYGYFSESHNRWHRKENIGVKWQ